MIDFFCPQCGDFTFEDITCDRCEAAPAGQPTALGHDHSAAA